MNGCPASHERLQYPENADNTSATVYDIAYIQLHRALHDRTVELTPEFGVCEAIEGERTMLEKPRLPRGWPADVTSLQSLRGRDEGSSR